MTTLKLTMMLGPRETLEVCEAGMPDMAHVLFAADLLEGWDADEVERVLMAAGTVFRRAIDARKHEEPPPRRHLPAEVEDAMRGPPLASPPQPATPFELSPGRTALSLDDVKVTLRAGGGDDDLSVCLTPHADWLRADDYSLRALVDNSPDLPRCAGAMAGAFRSLAARVAQASPLVRDTWGDPTPAERLAIEADAPLLTLRAEVARSLAPEAWVEADASLRKADAVLAVVERRREA